MFDKPPVSASNPFEPASPELARKKFSAFGHVWESLPSKEAAERMKDVQKFIPPHQKMRTEDEVALLKTLASKMNKELKSAHDPAQIAGIHKKYGNCS